MPHPNDMTIWSDITCQRGCAEHPTHVVNVRLGGPTRYADLTPIPNRFTTEFPMKIWNTTVTPVDGGPYCPARDAVSETILSHGVWEPQETTVLMLLWEALGQPVFFDFGAQVGWFSTIAARMGLRVHAWEADPDVARVLAWNLAAADLDLSTERVHVERITPGSDPLTYIDDKPIVAKVDVEGAEADVIRVLGNTISTGMLKALMVEMSPVFNDTYPDIAASLVDRGYRAYLMPGKKNPPWVLKQIGDLAPFEIEWVNEAHLREEVASWHQEDVVFILGGIEALQ